MKNTVICRYGVFKVRVEPPDQRLHVPSRQHGLSKLSSVRITYVEVDVISRRARYPDGNKHAINGAEQPTEVIAPISLERR